MLMIDIIKIPGRVYQVVYEPDGVSLDWGTDAGLTYAANLTDAEMRPEEEWRDHITENLTDRHWEACGLSCPVLTWGGTCRRDRHEECDGSYGKFDSAAAEVLYEWSLDGQPESCGDAQYGNGWHAFFPEDRAILHAANSGAVSAWRVTEDEDWDAIRAEIEAGAVTEDDAMDDDDDDDCPHDNYRAYCLKCATAGLPEAHPRDCRYCAAGESSEHNYEPPTEDDASMCECTEDHACPEHCDCGECDDDDAAECGCTRGQMCMEHAIQHNTGPTGIVFFPAPVTG